MRRGILGGIAAFLPALAAAQDAVVVTATRAPQPSLEIPASVDRLYPDDIREGRPQVNLSESLSAVPGIVVQNRQNYAQDLQVSSRGFGARSTFGVRGIRLYADGIPANQPDGQGQTGNFDLTSAGRIEVLRGPFASLYGNAAGGVISIETEDGPPVPTFEAGLYGASYGTWRDAAKFGGESGAVNGVASVSQFHTDGYRVHSAADRQLANVKLRLNAGEDTSITLLGNSVRQPETQDPQGLNRTQLADNPRQVNPTVLDFNTRKTANQSQGGLRLDHRLDSANRIEAVAYGGNRFVQQFLGFQTNGVVDLDTDYGGGALRYFWTGSRVRLSGGIEYETMAQRRKGFDNNFGTVGGLRRDEDDDVSSTGLFAQGEWQFAERWIAHAGVRASRVAFEVDDHLGTRSGDVTYTGTTPVAGLVYRLAPATSLYGNVGRGFETPTLVEIANRSGGAPGVNFDLAASRSRHSEIGVKTLLGRVARVNAALFHIVTENEIVVDQNVNGRASFKNVGHTDRDGFELGADTVSSGPWHARLAYTYLKARFRESFDTVVSGSAVAVAGGNQLPSVPRTLLYGELGYRRAPFFARLEGLHKSSVAVNDSNSQFADPFVVWNAVLGFTQERASWRVTEFARVDNLTNRNYVGSVIVNENAGRYYEPAPGQAWTIGIQAALRFL
jgi:iron complex outermembrane receptor protein